MPISATTIMSTPVVTNTWAGNFDCSVCRRKRLMAEEFSKKALEKHRKTGGPLKCKQCVQAAAQAEREAAAAKRTSSSNDNNNNNNNNNTTIATRTCAKCQTLLPQNAYNANQWNNKDEGQSKCRSCVEQMLAAQEQEATQQQGAATLLAQAKKAVQDAQTPAQRVAAESKVAALEAQKVTGLQPVRLGRGGRGGRGRGGSGRGRGRGGRVRR